MDADPVSRLFDTWAASFARGEQPDPRVYLDEAGDGAAELSQLMEAYLVAAPRAEPDAEAINLARAWLAGASPLADLRASRGIRRDEVVDAVMAEFALAQEKRPIVKSYYHRLESGLLDPARLSAPLLELLARRLETARETILAWRTRSLDVAPAFRAPIGEASVRASPGDEPDDPEIHDLFLSGR
jgi:hypothetical protein